MSRLFLVMIVLWLLPQQLLSQNQPPQVEYAPCNNCNANPPTYHAAQPFITSDISSDYGMRVVPNGSRFHQGIDYSKPDGTAIVNLVDGRVTAISEDREGELKFIVIDGRFDQNGTDIPNGKVFAYLHIFNNTQVLTGNHRSRQAPRHPHASLQSTQSQASRTVLARWLPIKNRDKFRLARRIHRALPALSHRPRLFRTGNCRRDFAF
jgi:hypothetical protein